MMNDDFVQELQSECLSDTKSALEDFVGEINNLTNDHSSVLNNLCKLLHNFKGNAQAVGFTNFANFFHLLESIIIPLSKLVPAHVEPQEIAMMEFYLSEMEGVIESYVSSLQNDFNDSQDLLLQKAHHIFHFKEWAENQYRGPFEFDNILSEVTSEDSYLESDLTLESSPESSEEDEFALELAEALETKTEEETVSSIESVTETEEPVAIIPSGNETGAHSEEPEVTISRFLLFKNNNQLYGINADQVLEVVKKAETTMVNTQDKKSVGMLKFKERFVEIYDIFQPLAQSWNLNLDQRDSYFIIMNTENGMIGFPSQEVDQVVEFDQSTFFELSYEIHHLPIFKQIHRHDDKDILILNPEKLRAA